MAKYLITYDLNRPGQVYSELADKINELGSVNHGMQNVWFLKTDKNASQIIDELRSVVDNNDELFVAELGNWASFNLIQLANWLNNAE